MAVENSKRKIKKSKRKIRNLGVGLMFFVTGSICTFGGVLFLLEQRQINESNLVTLDDELQSCKALGAKRGFRNKETTKGTLYFYQKNLKEINTYSALFNMQGIISNCTTMKIKEACIGYGCEIPKDIIGDSEGLPFYFVLEEKYTRIKK